MPLLSLENVLEKGNKCLEKDYRYLSQEKIIDINIKKLSTSLKQVFIHLKYVIQRLLAYSQSCATITIINLRTFLSFLKDTLYPLLITFHPPNNQL